MSHFKGYAAVGALILSTLLVAGTAIAQDDTTIIERGVDLFNTAPTGMTFVSFVDDPIPADFFCPGSPPFDGEIKLVGVPLVTEPPGIAYNTDTIVERLEDAFLEPGGAVQVPIRMVAMRLASIDPIRVDCEWGEQLFDLEVCLAPYDEQPVTMIEIIQTHEEGGVFIGDIIVVAELVFDGGVSGGPTKPIHQYIEMHVLENNRWMFEPGLGGFEIPYDFMVDTDCDDQPDRDLPGTSRFFPGWSPDMHDCFSKTPDDDGCHENPGGDHAHCPGTPCVEG